DGPWDELAALLVELRTQPEQLQALGSEILELGQRLPAEIDIGLDAIDPQATAALLDDVEALLWNRLTPAEDEG
ncbi:MAG TPA: hypothetical protein VFG20_18675, partial [Planctomycetaceae bacterium]|nr:hypothetical protein [Planctomycetaceae bacterium]